MAWVSDPQVVVWKGDAELRAKSRGIKVLGTPLGHEEFVVSCFASMQTTQFCWTGSLLWMICSPVGHSCCIVLQPEQHFQSVSCDLKAHVNLPRCMMQDCGDAFADCWIVAPAIQDVCTLPLVLGGLGLRSAVRTRAPSFWASWADTLHMIHLRHPAVADEIVSGTSDPGDCPTFHSLARVTRDPAGLAGFELPSWDALLHGARPSPRDPDEFEPSSQRFGWQHEAASRVEHHHRDRVLFPLLSDHEKALVRAQGSGSGGAFFAVPSSYATRFEPQLFRVLLLRRLHLPLPLSVRNCRCGRPLDSRGHHRALCAGWSSGKTWLCSGEGKVQVHQKNFHQKRLSSKTTFIKKPLSSKNHFHQKTTFIKNHFHQKPLSSKTTFIKDHFHQRPISSKTNFIRNHFPPEQKQYRPCSCEGVTGRRPRHTNTVYAHLWGLSRPFM